MRRSPAPRIALIAGSLVGNLPPVTIMFSLSLIGSLAVHGLPLQALLLPLLIAWLFVLTLALAMILGALTARFRDMNSLLPLIIQAGICVTPVGYRLQGALKNIQEVVTSLVELEGRRSLLPRLLLLGACAVIQQDRSRNRREEQRRVPGRHQRLRRGARRRFPCAVRDGAGKAQRGRPHDHVHEP